MTESKAKAEAEAKGGAPVAVRQSLENHLQEKIAKHRKYSLLRRVIALALLFSATICGALVVINVGTKWFSADGLSALTGVGAVLLALLRVGGFQEQAKWNKLKQRKLEGLHRRLVFEHADEAEVSAELTRANEELEQVRVWVEAPEELVGLGPESSGS